MRQNSISVVRTRNPKLYATLLAKTPEQTKKMDLNIFRSNLSEDEFKNLTQLYDQNDSAPDAIKSPFVFAVENYPFVDRNVAGLGFTNDDGETIDLGRVQKSEFIINANKQLQRQQQQNPDQSLTSSEIDRTLKQAELATQATTNGPGINDNTLNKIINSTSVIVNATDFDQQGSAGLSLPNVDRANEGLAGTDGFERPNYITLAETSDALEQDKIDADAFAMKKKNIKKLELSNALRIQNQRKPKKTKRK